MMPLAVFISISTPAVVNANVLAIFNAPQTKYEIRITSSIAYQATNIAIWDDQMTNEFKPKTEFVKKLIAFRKQAILNGMKLLTVDEILAEKRALRGEID
jgi:hypothetical protein